MNVIQHLRGMRKLEICVCVVSVLIGGFFGYIAYKAIGTLTGAVGGWLVGEAWCYYMRKLAAKVGWIFGSLFIIGGVLGGIAGIVDGVFLHLVCFPLYGETLNGGEIVLRSILDCLAIGAMCGGIYGCFNGAFWGLIYSIIAFMERRNKKLETAG